MAVERRRTKYDIYADVIEVIAKKGTASLTRVSYGANLPVDRAKKLLSFLVSHGFIREVDVGERVKFRATRWGLDYLETFNRMQRFFAALNEPVKVKLPEVVLPGRVTSGVKEVDSLLFGGIPENYAVLLTSPSCDEKELLVERFLEVGAKSGEVTFDVTTELSRGEILVGESNFHLFVCNPRADSMVKSQPNISKLKGVENLTDLNIALTSAFRGLDESSETPRRACIEIVSDVLLQHRAVQTRRWLSGLIPDLRSRGFTTMAVMNPQMHPSEEVHAILGMFDGEIDIYERETAEGVQKFLKVRKMHNQKYLETKLPLKRETFSGKP